MAAFLLLGNRANRSLKSGYLLLYETQRLRALLNFSQGFLIPGSHNFASCSSFNTKTTARLTRVSWDEGDAGGWTWISVWA